MGKSKKPFIDRKNSSTYHLLHRSQRDIANDVILEEGATNASDMILWPSRNNNADTNAKVLLTGNESARMTEWREKLSDLGLLDEDSGRYLKPIEGTGTFLDASGHVANPLTDARSHPNQEEDGLMEVNRQMESIPLSTEYMDEDIANVLFGDFEEGELEELNDEFILDAAKEPEGGEEGEAFDYDEHIRYLIETARREEEHEAVVPTNHVGQSDQDFFSKFKPLTRQDDDDESFANIGEGTVATIAGVVPALKPDEERALCEKFEEALLEYDSDDLADCPEQDIRGPREFDGDVQLDAAMNDFLLEKDDDIFIVGNIARKPNSGFAVLAGALTSTETETVAETLRRARETLARPLQKPPAEEVLIDGKSYFSERERNPWDCESILTTYSNLDNNPVVVDPRRRRCRKKKNSKGLAPVDKSPSEQILLSTKTGIPLTSQANVYEGDDFEDTIVSVNRGAARDKKETPAEKRARKVAVKRERELARIQKKVTREVFQEEFQRRSIDVGADDVAGQTVFRYS